MDNNLIPISDSNTSISTHIHISTHIRLVQCLNYLAALGVIGIQRQSILLDNYLFLLVTLRGGVQPDFDGWDRSRLVLSQILQIF